VLLEHNLEDAILGDLSDLKRLRVDLANFLIFFGLHHLGEELLDVSCFSTVVTGLEEFVSKLCPV